MRKSMLAAAGLLLANGYACGTTSCTAEYRYGLVVRVLSASTGTPSCVATVTLTDGAYRETLAPRQMTVADGGTECSYPGAGERAGTYTIDATLARSEKTVANIVVTHDACHVVAQSVTLEL